MDERLKLAGSAPRADESNDRAIRARRGLFGPAMLIGAALLCALATPTASATAATLPTLTISMAAGSVTVRGAVESGAIDLVTTATPSLKEPSAVLVRLRHGVSVGELLAYLAKNLTQSPDTIAPYGSIVFDREALPGASTESETSLAPGTYVALDAEGEKSSGWTHASFEVLAAADPAPLPAPAAVERSRGFAFLGPRTLRRGELVRFENEGPAAHMDIAFRARSRAAAERLAMDLRTGRERAAEALVAGAPANFTGALSRGGAQQETITAAPGWYVQACFLEVGGRPDTRLGMERVIRILS